MKKKMENGGQFDLNQVKVNPNLIESFDATHQVIDSLIESTQKTIEKNKSYFNMFET